MPLRFVISLLIDPLELKYRPLFWVPGWSRRLFSSVLPRLCNLLDVPVLDGPLVDLGFVGQVSSPVQGLVVLEEDMIPFGGGSSLPCPACLDDKFLGNVVFQT